MMVKGKRARKRRYGLRPALLRPSWPSSETYDFQAYLAAALIYIATVETIRRLWNVLDKRINHHRVICK